MSSPGAVTRLANAAASQMGSIDVWINNAGYSGRYQVGKASILAKHMAGVSDWRRRRAAWCWSVCLDKHVMSGRLK